MVETLTVRTGVKKTPRQRLTDTIFGLCWSVKQEHPDLSDEEVRTLVGSTLRRLEPAIVCESLAR